MADELLNKYIDKLDAECKKLALDLHNANRQSASKDKKLKQIADIVDRGIKNSLCNCGLRADLEQINQIAQGE